MDRVPGISRDRAQHIRTFGTTTVELLTLRDWLEADRVTHVAMESTGVYWRPVFYVLEEIFAGILANATQIAQVPGRKTGVNNAAWIAQLLEYGLIRASFAPPPPIRELRDLTRYRKLLIQERTRHANRLHKVLEDTGIKLTRGRRRPRLPAEPVGRFRASSHRPPVALPDPPARHHRSAAPLEAWPAAASRARGNRKSRKVARNLPTFPIPSVSGSALCGPTP